MAKGGMGRRGAAVRGKGVWLQRRGDGAGQVWNGGDGSDKWHKGSNFGTAATENQ